VWSKALKISLVAYLLIATVLPVKAEVVNEMILRVNDRVTTLFDYLERRASAREEILRSDRLSPEERERLLAELPKRVMQQVFRDLLLESRADQMEIFVSEQEVDSEIGRMRERNEMKTQAELEEALAQAGLTMEKLRREFESELRIQRVVGDEVRAKIKVEEDDLRRYYRANPADFQVPEKRQASEIVVLEEGPGGPEAQRQLAADIVTRLRAGEDAEAVAAPLAEAAQTSSVIRFGWVEPGHLDETLEAALWSLKKGEVSEPVSGRGGWHILLLHDLEASHVQPFNEVKESILYREQNRVFNEDLENYLRELAQTAYIVERIPADAQGYRNTLAGPLREPFQVLGEGRESAPAEAAASTTDSAPESATVPAEAAPLEDVSPAAAPEQASPEPAPPEQAPAEPAPPADTGGDPEGV
jgi:parvulin-like peptidyl-prolyl isomerase